MQLECDESGCAFVPVSSDNIVVSDVPTLHCDVTGPFQGLDRCRRGHFFLSPLPPQLSPANLPPSRLSRTPGCHWDMVSQGQSFELLEGDGWRLGWERSPSGADFCALVGSDTWSVSFRASEFNDFLRLLKTLQQSVAAMSEEGDWGKSVGDEQVLDVRSKLMWMQARCPRESVSTISKFMKKLDKGEANAGTGDAFDLRFVVTAPGEREVEGFLPASAVAGMLAKMKAAETQETFQEAYEQVNA